MIMLITILVIILILVILLNFNTPRSKIFKTLDLFIYPLSKIKDTSIHEYIKKYLTNEYKTVLNFGCGPNTYSETLYELGYEVTAVDIMDQGVSDIVPVTVYSVSDDIPGDKYDLVIISTVLHHIPYDKQFEILKKIKEKTNNIIILEDYSDDPENNILSFLKASLICAVTNLSFIKQFNLYFLCPMVRVLQAKHGCLSKVD